ncbi:MAG: methyltransferase domain-containing protein [Candidatus Buchananbacteria bacterium]
MKYNKLIFKLKHIFSGSGKNTLNVAAYLEILRLFGCRHIHYGYYKNHDNDIVAAQENLSQLVINSIPINTQNIIDIGGGFGGMAGQLLKLNYDCLCVVPHEILVKYGKKVNSAVSFLAVAAEDLITDIKFDLATLVESYQYFTNPELAIQNVVNCLKENSSLIVLDEFDQDGGILKNIENRLIKILNQNNYQLIQKQDLTKNIFPTIDFIINSAKGLNIKELANIWQETKDIYTDKDRKYLLLKFSRQKNP